PVAQLKDQEGVYVDETGQVYFDPFGREVPVVEVPESYLDVSVCVIGQWPREGIVRTVSLMQQNLPQLDYSLELDAKSVLSLQVTEGPKFVLGSSEKMDEKVKKISEAYGTEGLKLNKSTVIN